MVSHRVTARLARDLCSRPLPWLCLPGVLLGDAGFLVTKAAPEEWVLGCFSEELPGPPGVGVMAWLPACW